MVPARGFAPPQKIINMEAGEMVNSVSSDDTDNKVGAVYYKTTEFRGSKTERHGEIQSSV